jgi:hypothetical protein
MAYVYLFIVIIIMDIIIMGYGLVNRFIGPLYALIGTTLYRSLTQTQTSVLSLLRSPLAIYWQRLLTVEIFQLPTLRFSYHSRPCRTLVN